MGETGIEWTDETWPVTRGCEQVSPGCKNCYAKRMAARIVRMGRGAPTKYDGLVRLTKGGDPQWTGTARFCPEELATPLSKRGARRIFVSSMSDLFHDDITNEQIAAVFGVMAACPQHAFQLLTKRARRMREWFEWVAGTGHDPGHVLSLALGDLAEQDRNSDARFSDDEWLVGLCNVVNGRSSWSHHDDGNPLDGSRPRWPLPNVWMGVSVENQAAADERIPELLRTPAAVRFLSCEPLLGPLRLMEEVTGGLRGPAVIRTPTRTTIPSEPVEYDVVCEVGIDWVIAGCESGPGARPADVAWYRSLRDQCAAAGVAFFLKQACSAMGDTGTLFGGRPTGAQFVVYAGTGSHRKPGGIIGAPYLDGVQHLALPEVRRD